MTFSRIAGLTSGWPDRTRDTDEIATPAKSATSRMPARPPALSVLRAMATILRALQAVTLDVVEVELPAQARAGRQRDVAVDQRRAVGHQVPPDRVAIGVEAL